MFDFWRLSHSSFHIGPYIKLECRYQPEAKPRADIDRGLDISTI